MTPYYQDSAVTIYCGDLCQPGPVQRFDLCIDRFAFGDNGWIGFCSPDSNTDSASFCGRQFLGYPQFANKFRLPSLQAKMRKQDFCRRRRVFVAGDPVEERLPLRIALTLANGSAESVAEHIGDNIGHLPEANRLGIGGRPANGMMPDRKEPVCIHRASEISECFSVHASNIPQGV